MLKERSTKDQPTKMVIVRALAELMGAASLKDIRVKEVLAKAEVTRSVFYYHFESLDDALEYMIEFFVDGLAGAVKMMIPVNEQCLRGFGQEGSSSASMAMFHFVYDNRELYQALSRDVYVAPVFTNRLHDRLIEAYEACDYFFHDTEGNRCMLAPREREYYIESIVSRHTGAIHCWYRRNFAERPEELMKLLVVLDASIHAPTVELKKRYKDYGQIKFVSWRDLGL